jgi:hypothetical protein
MPSNIHVPTNPSSFLTCGPVSEPAYVANAAIVNTNHAAKILLARLMPRLPKRIRAHLAPIKLPLPIYLSRLCIGLTPNHRKYVL